MSMRFIVDEVTKIAAADGQRDLVLKGEVERGIVRKGMTTHLEILGQNFKVRRIVADGSGGDVEEATEGEQVGVVLAGLQNVRVQLGEVLVDAGEDG